MTATPPSGSGGAGPGGAIAPPPPPYTIKLPHNLFTLDEVLAALQLLETGGLASNQQARVGIGWANGARQRLLLTELPRLTQIEEVKDLSVYWTYADGSTVSGDLLNRPARGELTVENGPQARAAADRCVESLRVVNQQRAAVRGVLAGSVVPVVLGVLMFVSGVIVQARLRGDVGEDLTPEVALYSGLFGFGIGAAVAVLTGLATRGLRRRFSGTRLAPGSQAHRKLLTNEVAVLAAVLGVPIALLAVVVTALVS